MNKRLFTICIPKINRDIKKKMIFSIFKKYNFGKIKRVDLIKMKNNTQRAFIHYLSWNDDEKSVQVKKWLLEGKDIKIIYSQPWFWKCSITKNY